MNYEIIESFAQMVKEKGIDKDVLAGIVEEIFSMLMKKKFGPDAQFEVVVNLEKGEIEIYLEREVVEEVEDPSTQISLKEAKMKSDEEIDVGDIFPEEIKLDDFGRRLITLAKQTLAQRLREIEKDIIFHEYSQLLNEIVVGDIYQIRKDDILVNHNKNELILPRS
ncbi:MAG: transcription termination/antitermination protein NusA, partial [Ignavibacteria bacterium]|nr:transcription termination/antitermination protein NusA [Ignavibacteria bacterium]